MTRATKERIAAAVLLLVALALLGVGMRSEHKVYDPTVEEFGLVAFERISETELVIDSTFGGVRLDKDHLYTTYDRTQAQGKRACPT
jgi:hypothetical protein